MTAVMEGVRILEVAEHTFVPAASAMLADWGAEVIKIEHVERGDAMRGLASSGIATTSAATCTCCSSTPTAASRASASTSPPTRASTSSTSWLPPATCSSPTSCPRVRAKLSIDWSRSASTIPTSSMCAAPARVSVGPEADRGSYDSLAYWARAGVAMGAQVRGGRLRPAAAGPGIRRLDRCHDDRRR